MGTVAEKGKLNVKQKQAFDFFRSQGYSKEASAGIVGNLVYESGLSTSIEGDIGFKGGSSYGIAQFRGDRLKSLQNTYGKDWTKFENQLAFVAKELNTTHKKAGNILKNTADVHQAGRAFSDLYEVPAKKYHQNAKRRESVATIYNSLGEGRSIGTPIADQAIAMANEYFNQQDTTTFKDLENERENLTFVPLPSEVQGGVKAPSAAAEVKSEDKDIEELKQQTKEQNFLANYQTQNEPQPLAAPEAMETEYEPDNLIDIYGKVSQFVDSEVAQQGGAKRTVKLNTNPNRLENESDVSYENRKKYNEFRIRQEENKNPVKKWYNEMEASQKKDTNLITRAIRQTVTSPLHLANYLHSKLDTDEAGKYKSDNYKAKEKVKALGSTVDAAQLITLGGLDLGMKAKPIIDQIITGTVKGVSENWVQDKAENFADNVADLYYQQQGGVPVSKNGVYDYPMQNVLVPTDNGRITMKDVKYPILGIDNLGNKQMMLPGKEYQFKGKEVMEFPQLSEKEKNFLKAVGKSKVAQQGLTIKKGDNLSTIARQNGVSVQDLAKYNNISNPDLIREGQKINIPQNSSRVAAPQGKPTTFNEAFKIARQELGANQIFEFDGKKYGTNVAGEKFEPSEETLKNFNLNDPVTKNSLKRQNKQVASPFTTKEVTKLESGYKDWESIKRRNDEINKMDDADKLISFQKGKPEEQYMILDKKAARMHLYKGGKLLDSFEVGLGETKSDQQTVTKQVDGHTDWSAGNMSTGAGIYTISNPNPSNKSYYGLPSFNMKNENGIEVATSIHGTPTSRRAKLNDSDVNNNRISTGCVNGKCQDLKDLYSKYKVREGTKMYVLPEDEGNSFELVDGKPILKVKDSNRKSYNSYIDSKGNVQKGQGVNLTTKTLNYKPIKLQLDEKRFKNDVFTALDFNDEDEYTNTTKPFVKTLETSKKQVMQAAKIPSDVYNEIARIAFGIYGTESNFGDTHGAANNFLKAVNKFTNSDNSSPDYLSKATTYGANGKNNSVGSTQIRFSYLNKDEKAALKKVGITKNTDFLEPEKAAVGTAVVLGVRYNQQLTASEKKDIWKNLPAKWNNRGNYSERVIKNAGYLKTLQKQ